MADQLTATGLSIDDYETRRANVVSDLRSVISAVLDDNPELPTGQLVDIILERVQSNAELLQDLHSAIAPAQATGQSLDAVSSITGTYRRAATKGTVELTLNLNAGITVPTGSIAAVSGDPDNEWVLTEDVTSVGAGNYTGAAEASETGPIAAPSGTITVIVTPVAGWNTVTNVSDADLGDDEETDAALRVRRLLQVTLGGSASVDSIRADLVDLTGMEQVAVYENDSWAIVSPMPPHSIEAVIWDGVAPAVANADIAEAIFNTKPAGIEPYGSTTVVHTDDQGNTHNISFTRASQFELEMNITLATNDDYPGNATLTAALVAWADANYEIGGLKGYAVYTEFLSLFFSLVDGIEDVNFTWRELAVGGYVTSNLAVGDREIPTLDSANIHFV